MSGAEVIGIISGIIAILDVSHKVYRAVEDASGLPPSFRDVGSRLPLVQDSLRAAYRGLAEDHVAPECSGALKTVLEGCKLKAAGLERIFRATIPPVGASRTTKYLKALRTIPNATKVEGLMDGIMSDLHVLTANHAVKTATRAQIMKLMAAVDMDNGGGFYEDKSSVVLHNLGSGSQFVHRGVGNQNMTSGTGLQFNGAMTGDFYLARG
ncbi:hypothetical protein HRG_003866 [Hirsutella rhossiliensis]|uniref:NACHT-NTPase and P-loop NTPases N-terminal domain-containing protein n=1 Tax=Hirsutella rhossiliensis TaxID=111463 RepID=A0A9P8N2T9_9HYPO|nr:uncharacterized protein HRG_03866 [Hirsutella rhossiliensis]KAH0965850.1 hypothetical protein HRG_03866 [Hirsutella rhossiliensis]